MTIALRFGLCLAFISFCLMPALAQDLDKSSARPPAESPADPNVAERVRLLESELERQNSKLDQLQKTLLEQQQTIQALLEKISAQPVAATAKAKEIEAPVSSTAPT